jgi:hypothetical protein
VPVEVEVPVAVQRAVPNEVVIDVPVAYVNRQTVSGSAIMRDPAYTLSAVAGFGSLDE